MKKNKSIPDIHAVLGTKKSGSRSYIKYAIAAIILICGALFLLTGNDKQAQGSSFQTKDVKRGDITVSVSATGTLEPTNQVDVGSELSGTIREVFADFNTTVTKGQLLARIDTAKLSAQVTQYRAALESERAGVLQAEATEKETLLKLNQLKKLKELTEGRSPSETDLDAAEAAYSRAQADTAVAKAAVTKAKATLDVALTDLSKAEIRSPVNGVVLDRSIDAGQTVAASYQAPVLFTLAEDLKQMELHVYVDEADIGSIQAGQKAEFTVDAYPEKIFRGAITQTRFGSETVDNVVTYETVISVDNSDMLLRPGMTATATIVTKKLDDILLIPNAALRYAPEETSEEGSSSLLGKLMPRPPRSDKKQAVSTAAGMVTVYALENGMEVPHSIKLGDADSSYKQMLEGDLKEGAKLITGKMVNGR